MSSPMAAFSPDGDSPLLSLNPVRWTGGWEGWGRGQRKDSISAALTPQTSEGACWAQRADGIRVQATTCTRKTVLFWKIFSFRVNSIPLLLLLFPDS